MTLARHLGVAVLAALVIVLVSIKLGSYREYQLAGVAAYLVAVAGLTVLIGLSVLATTLAGRPGDSITAAITTTVVMVLAGVSPHDAWQQPIFRFADTLIGVVVGIAAASAALRVIPQADHRGSDST